MKNPIKPTLRTEGISLCLLVASIVLSFYFYSRFPETVPIHWNIKGEPDNYGSSMFGAFIFPFIIFSIYIMFLVLPILDPRKNRYEQFAKTYHRLKTLIMFVVFGIYVISGLNILGYNIPINVWVPGLVGLLFIVLGNYMTKIKNNWFIGIRTPWTLSSERVWNKTHRLAGKLFVLGGVVMILLNFIPPNIQMPVFITVVAGLVMIPVIYSYFIYAKENKDNDKTNR